MIKNIIFDFGDVFINLDKSATEKALFKLGVNRISDEMYNVYYQYEQGKISTKNFIDRFKKLYPSISSKDFISAWNAILQNTPKHRLDFIKSLKKSNQYRLFLLSNTNDLHISWIQKNWGEVVYNEFKSCFEQFYLSHEIGLRKPNSNIYEFVLQENELVADETFFIDDTKENIDTAKSLGIHVWNINPDKEDVVNLQARKEFLKCST